MRSTESSSQHYIKPSPSHFLLLPTMKISELTPSPIADLDRECVAAFIELKNQLVSQKLTYETHCLMSAVEIACKRYGTWQQESFADLQVQTVNSLDRRLLEHSASSVHVQGHMKALRDTLMMSMFANICAKRLVADVAVQ